MQWRDLIAASRLLASMSDSDTVPLPDSQRRAVSMAYYTVFHALANSNADYLIGPPTNPLLKHGWHRVRRGLGQPHRRPYRDCHRLATLSRADRLVVLNRGHILATGTHRELMKARGRYWAMVQAQRVLAEFRMLSTIQDMRS